jgi:hypothetical protein
MGVVEVQLHLGTRCIIIIVKVALFHLLSLSVFVSIVSRAYFITGLWAVEYARK